MRKVKIFVSEINDGHMKGAADITVKMELTENLRAKFIKSRRLLTQLRDCVGGAGYQVALDTFEEEGESIRFMKDGQDFVFQWEDTMTLEPEGFSFEAFINQSCMAATRFFRWEEVLGEEEE